MKGSRSNGAFLTPRSRYASVNVIVTALHANAAEELWRWNKAASHAVWRDIHEVRLHFPVSELTRNTREEVGKNGHGSHRQQEVRSGIGEGTAAAHHNGRRA